jgi:hypothetical protein
MTWNICKVVFRLLAPMHIGWIKQGNVQRTRPYVAGKALWGALTARLTRDFPHLGGDYETVGKRVSDELAFSYFYPAVGETVDLWPWGERADEFAWRYLGSYASTALNYGCNTAEEGSLHETEFIAPHTRDGRPVYLVGYIFERQGCTLPWQEVLSRLQLGGERTYGWGRVGLHKLLDNGQEFFNSDLALDLNGKRPVVTVSADKELLAHALAVDFQGHRKVSEVRGSIEPLLGRETDPQGRFGAHLPEARICWQPGGTLTANAKIIIGEYGIWEGAP